MKRIRAAIAVASTVIVAATAGLAQHTGHGQHQKQSPYADLTTRPIKALSNDQLADLRLGRGMARSVPAELNGYPGPKHVQELADQLALSAAQRTTTSRLIDAMSAEAIAIGAEMISQEATLEALFADRVADDDRVRAAVDRIGALQGNLRFVHLKYHLAMQAALTPDQIKQYAARRGYTPTKQ